MKTLLSFVILVGGLGTFTNCASLHDPFLDLRPGMTPNQVGEQLGTPRDRRFSGDHEEWIYDRPDYYPGSHTKVVIFDKGRLTSLADDEIANERHYEIERARAGATRINIGGTTPADTRCTYQSAFGKYPHGGGCNVYGCWPAGGSCTVFGCSASGDCGVNHCPDRINSFHCAE